MTYSKRQGEPGCPRYGRLLRAQEALRASKDASTAHVIANREQVIGGWLAICESCDGSVCDHRIKIDAALEGAAEIVIAKWEAWWRPKGAPKPVKEFMRSFGGRYGEQQRTVASRLDGAAQGRDH